VDYEWDCGAPAKPFSVDDPNHKFWDVTCPVCMQILWDNIGDKSQMDPRFRAQARKLGVIP
jgi:hypothetical protein